MTKTRHTNGGKVGGMFEGAGSWSCSPPPAPAPARTAPVRWAYIEERDRLWPEVVAQAPGYGDYQTKTTRVIPIVFLDRA